MSSPIVKRSPFVLPLAFLAAVAMVFISEGSYRQAVSTLDALGTMATARSHIQSLERSMLNAETGQRGYLLSGDSEYRKPYDDALHGNRVLAEVPGAALSSRPAGEQSAHDV